MPTLKNKRSREKALKARLELLLASCDRQAAVARDPLALVHAYEAPEDQEVAGLVASALAYGRVKAIQRAAGRVLEVLGPRPSQGLEAGRHWALLGFVYRFQKGDDLPHFLEAARRLRAEHQSLAQAFSLGFSPGSANLGGAIDRFSERLTQALPGEISPGLRFLLPRTHKMGAAKRSCLYLRWMLRGPDGVDLGSWTKLGLAIPKSALIIPLDTHIARISGYLGLTERKSRDLGMALEITEALARLCPKDPLRYDLALCHLGISGDCGLTRTACEACAIAPLCRRKQLLTLGASEGFIQA